MTADHSVFIPSTFARLLVFYLTGHMDVIQCLLRHSLFIYTYLKSFDTLKFCPWEHLDAA